VIVAPGSTSVSITVTVVDDSGLAVTGLVAATFPATVYERVAEAEVPITLSDLAAVTSTYSSGGVKEVGGGDYRLDVPDAAFDTATRLRVRGEATGKHLLCPHIDVKSVQAQFTQDTGVAFPGNFSLLGINFGGEIANVAAVGLLGSGAIPVGVLTAPAIADVQAGLATAAGVPTAAQNADQLLDRHLAGGADATGLDARSVRNALRAGRNKVAFDVPVAGQFTVYAEDDLAVAWTGTYSRAATAANPLTGVDPT
jgi:hypothetical protein